MSGTVVSNVFRTSGVIAATAAGISFESTVTTGTTLSVEAGKGYFINTTSNICTVTLPSSAAAGDQIVLVDFARTWGTNKIVIDSNGLNFQGQDDTYTVEYGTSGVTVNIVYSGSSKGWTPISDDVVTDAPVAPRTQKGIFAFGSNSSGKFGVSNLMNSSGVIGGDVSAVGTAHNAGASCSYGGDKAIFGFGNSSGSTSVTNLINSSGVVSSDVSGVGTGRGNLTATGYGGDKGMFAYGDNGPSNTRNLVNSSGVVSADATGAGTARRYLAAAGYGVGLAIFGYGRDGGSGNLSMTNLVNDQGVVGSDVSGVGTARQALGAVSYGSTGQAMFAYGAAGPEVSVKNLVNNVGVVSADVTGVGTARKGLASASYGGDKAAFCYGDSGPSPTSISNLVSNSGVIASDVTGAAGSTRVYVSGAGYSYSA